MLLIPNANIVRYHEQATPERWQAWVGILRQYGTETPTGWQVPWEKYNAVSASRATGTYDPVAYPPPAPAPEPTARPAAMGGAKTPGIVDNRAGGRGCSGCGGVSAVQATGSPEAINAVLAE